MKRIVFVLEYEKGLYTASVNYEDNLVVSIPYRTDYLAVRNLKIFLLQEYNLEPNSYEAIMDFSSMREFNRRGQKEINVPDYLVLSN